MKFAIASVVSLTLAAALISHYGSPQQLLVSCIAGAGFICGAIASVAFKYIKTPRIDLLLKDFRYAKMRHDLRRSIKP